MSVTWCQEWDWRKTKRVEDEPRIKASSSLPFPVFKTTGDEKNEVFVDDMKDYCIMNNWCDASKETAEEKWKTRTNQWLV